MEENGQRDKPGKLLLSIVGVRSRPGYDQLNPVFKFEFSTSADNVFSHRVHADTQQACYLLVTFTFSKQGDYFELSRG